MSKRVLILGDLFAIALITLIGFATHREADLSFLPRMVAIYFPLTISWFILGPLLGLFQEGTTSDPKQLWRPAMAMVFGAPLTAVLRGLILNTPIIPIFAIVLCVSSALGMLIWRLIWYWLAQTRLTR